MFPIQLACAPLLSLFSATGAALLQEPAPGLPQYPTPLSDGSAIVFSLAGDLWLVGREGGTAGRLTQHAGLESRSAYRVEGGLLAFESNRDGAQNLYVADLDSEAGVLGDLRRVGVQDSGQTLSGFSADGTALLYSGYRNTGTYRSPRMFRVELDGAPTEEVLPVYGHTLRETAGVRAQTFARGRDLSVRPRYRGPGTGSIWIHTPSGEYRELAPSDAHQDSAFPLPDGDVLFLSARSGQNALWRVTPGLDPVSVFEPPLGDVASNGHGLRDLGVSADGGTAAFCLWDQLLVLDLTDPSAEPAAVEYRISADVAGSTHLDVDFSGEVREAKLSPDGETLAVISRGEVFVRPVAEGRATRRVTQTAGREAGLAWSPDGRVLYFSSDDSGDHALMQATVALTRSELEPAEEESAEESEEEDAAEGPVEAEDEGLTEEGEEPAEGAAEEEEGPDYGAAWAGALRFEVAVLRATEGLDYTLPTPSPNGEHLAYVRGLGDLMLHDLGSGDERVVFEGWDEPELHWLADGVHLAYAVSDLDFNADVWIVDLGGAFEGAEFSPVNVTQHPDLDYAPRVSTDGKWLYFLSDRAGQNFNFDVWRISLDKALLGMEDWELDAYYEKAGKAAGKREPLVEGKFDVESFELDLERAWNRTRRMTRQPEGCSDLLLAPSGERFAVATEVDGEAGLYSFDRSGEERKRVARGGVDDVTVDLQGKRVLYIGGSQANSAPLGGGDGETHSISARSRVDLALERDQKFTEAWRVLGRGFYHPTLKGLDWDALGERYGALAGSTRTTQAFNRVVGMLFGELDGSHLGISGGESYRAPSVNTGYLGVDVVALEGGYEVVALLDDAPAADAGVELQPGDRIVAVEDRALVDASGGLLVSLDAAFAGRAGIETLIEVQRAGAAESELLLVTPVGSQAERNLRYRHEIEQRRQAVERLSNGRLGYLHIRGMNQPSVREFEQDLFAAADGREALLIDVRDNGGGSTTDILLSSLTAPRHAYTVPRGADAATVPNDAYPRDRRLIYSYQRPIAVLINENSFSNAEIFAHSIRTTGRGRLIGTQTFGGVISTGSASLIDGARVRMPFRGWYLPDGTDMEHNGALPDLDVARTPGDEAAGNDAQLEAAVADLLSTLDG